VFKGRHFDRSVILLCVRWYLAYNLSLRDLEEMMTERGISRLMRKQQSKYACTPQPSLVEQFDRLAA
jgi:transposase-like protein